MSEDKPKGALVLTHLQPEGSCTLGQTLVSRGMRIRTINTPREGLENIDPLRPDLLIVMGGPVGVYQADDYPFLKQEMDILKARIADDLPTIGICLGSQLMASALGSNVYKGSQGKEVGWQSLNVTEAGKGSAAELICAPNTNMFHWHGDTFDLPEGAALLASSDQYENQVYSHGKALGLQCHPEVQEHQLQEWFVMFQGDVTGDNPLIPVNELRAQTREHIDTLNTQAKLFFSAWLDEVGL